MKIMGVSEERDASETPTIVRNRSKLRLAIVQTNWYVGKHRANRRDKCRVAVGGAVS